MVKKTGKETHTSYAVEGRFDSKAAFSLLEKLQQDGNSLSDLTLDFSSSTHITAGGIAALRQLGEQMRADGQNLAIKGMRSEMYKALKIAGISDALVFSHRSSV